jgi:uncharacterized protein DUF1876
MPPGVLEVSTNKVWNIDISIDEEPETRATTAHARLICDDGVSFMGEGGAFRYPRDPELPAVGDDLAAARALSDLARQLATTAYMNINDATGPRNDAW